jgi:hypothetical protein
MKKAKIMLVAIAVLAAVGGTLAFKASKAFGFDYCYRATTDNSTTSCTDDIIGYRTVQEGQPFQVEYYYTLKDVENCALISCTVSSTLTKE